MPTVNDCKRLLDEGWNISLWSGSKGSYSAQARAEFVAGKRPGAYHNAVTASTPEQALCRLVEKMSGNIVEET